MKTFLTFIFVIVALAGLAQDNTPFVINLRDNSKLQFNGAPVKMKASIMSFTVGANKEWTLRISVQYFESVAGAYGAYIPTTIQNDGTLTADEKAILLEIYANRDITYTTVGRFVDATGNSVPQGTPGSTSELAYWQSFRLNQIPGIASISATNALEAMSLTITAIVTKMNSRKSW